MNRVADALSHRDEDTAVLFALSRPTILIFYAIRNELSTTKSLSQLRSKIEKEEMGAIEHLIMA